MGTHDGDLRFFSLNRLEFSAFPTWGKLNTIFLYIEDLNRVKEKPMASFKICQQI